MTSTSTLRCGATAAGREAAPGPRLTLMPDEAAAVLGVGRTTFYEYVMPELRAIRLGRKRLIPVSELEDWTDRNAARILE